MPAPPPPAPSGVPAPPSLRLGDGRFVLEPAERRLLCEGKPVDIGARALDLLIVLAAHPDHLLTKTELLERVWSGLVVEEANLQIQVGNLRKLLGPAAIATVPGRGYRFAAEVAVAGAPSPLAAPAVHARASGMPAAAAPATGAQRLIGRDADRQALAAMLEAAAGCITIVGMAGVGKTTLARHLAAGRPGRHAFVDLASLSGGDEVADAVARALEMELDDSDRAGQIARALGAEPRLLVLDNAEHVVQAVAALVGRLQAVPGHVLVTSQLPLNIAGERVYRLLPLALPSESSQHHGDDAVALLVDRIVAADRRFSVSADNQALLQAICAQLDGLPLALEMAAARVPAMGLSGVRDALSERFALLTRGHRDATTRHRTLRNALDWSYRLLDAPTQRMFRALGVFADGFTLDLAVAFLVEGDEAGPDRWDVIDRITTLIDHSLLVPSADDPPRYHLLETMRAFAAEQLFTAAEEPATRARQARALLGVLARFGPLGRPDVGSPGTELEFAL